MNTEFWGIGWGMFGSSCVLAHAWIRVKAPPLFKISTGVGDSTLIVSGNHYKDVQKLWETAANMKKDL